MRNETDFKRNSSTIARARPGREALPKPSAEAQTAGRIAAEMQWTREEIRRQDEEVRCKAQRQAAHNFGKKLAVMLPGDSGSQP